MAFKFQELSIPKLAVVGAGQIGPDIALHFTKVLAPHKVPVVLVDISAEALQKAEKKIGKKIDKGMETGAFKEEQARKMKDNIQYTTNYQEIKGSGIVLEAATENEKVKHKIFSEVEKLCKPQCLFFSNSSHMQPENIFSEVEDQSRCMVTHYFFPAERNPIVEVVPGENTSEHWVSRVMDFYEFIGKIPIRVKSSYGYAIDPVFEGLGQAAILCLERGYGSEKEIDQVARETLGLGVGPFTALNLTGGNPITAHGLDKMNKLLMPWFRTPDKLKEAVENNTSWNTASRGEKVEVEESKKDRISREFLGAYFGLASFIIDLGITNVSDLDMAAEIALVVKPPFRMMNKIGIQKALSLVKEYSNNHQGFKVPTSLLEAGQKGGWKISRIMEKREEDVAVLTIRRPKVLNALNKDVVRELKERLVQIENDPNIRGSVLTGYGNKAFVSGADIQELAKLKTPEEAYRNCREYHEVLNSIENLKKPVVCAMNGIAFGGGNELAMACTLRISRKNMPVLIRQPEVNLGFIPGAGGTQRLPRIVGLDKGAEILRTGRVVSSKEAKKLGLIYDEVKGDLVKEGIRLARKIAQGKLKVKSLYREPLELSNGGQDLQLGHLSRKIDGILKQAIYEGATLNLNEGLEKEAKLFGECLNTEDMKIGLKTFMTKGPKAKAEFVNR